jgi:hypothetical protein
LLEHSHDHHNRHGLTLTAAKHAKQFHKSRPVVRTVKMFGISLTNDSLQKFIQVSLLVNSFYLSIFLCTFLRMYVDGKLPLMWLISPLVLLGTNLMLVTPWTMFLGFGCV